MEKKEYEEHDLLKPSEIAEWTNLSRQAVYCAIRSKKLNSTRYKNKILCRFSDVLDWQKLKYNRDKTVVNGEHIFDISKNRWSPSQLSKALEIPMSRVYYLIRLGELRSTRMGNSFVIHANIDELKALYFYEHPSKRPPSIHPDQLRFA